MTLTKTAHLQVRPVLTFLLAAAVLAQQNSQAASNSLPTGGTFVAGAGHISAAGNTLTINQNSLKGIIDWNSFSLSPGATINFQNGSGATLNRVTGGTPSAVLGRLLASGTIYLLNPEGVLIGRGAVINTGGDFLAATLNLPNSSFLNNRLDFSGSSTAAVINLGDISSSGGNVYLIGHAVQNEGSIASPNGTAGLAAGEQVLITDSSSGQKVAVLAPGGDVTNSGFINAAQVELKSNGGNIYALAGNNGGQINATGTATEDGHIWLIATNGTTSVEGGLSATGIHGSGGDIETSGARVVTSSAQITTGKGGNWLLDPDDLTIDSTLAATIESSLNGGTNVTEQTGSGNSGTGNIFVNSNIAWTTGANLTLSAFQDIDINNGVTIANTGSGNLTLRADNTSTGTGTINFAGNGKIDYSASTGFVSLLYNPSSYAAPTVYTPNVLTNSSVSSQMTAYMLVNNSVNLQNIDLNDAGTYALGQNIDLSGIANFTPIGITNPFSGIFDGQGHSISNLTITSASTGNIGLFSDLSSSGQIRNVSLLNANVNITASSSNSIGLLAGEADGMIVNSSAAGSLTATGSNTLSVGGLVGLATGSIQGSHAAVTVDASTATQSDVGGLVGFDNQMISNSFATGSVAGGSQSKVGGLAGVAYGAANSYATGAVSNGTGSQAQAGGLIGENNGPVTNSYATGAVSGTADYAGGLVGNNSSASNNASPITGSYSTGAVTDAGEYIGGLAGATSSSIINSYATGSVTPSSGYYVGGLAGFSNAAITGSHASGVVTCSSSGCELGGLVGLTISGGTIASSYATGSVTGGPSADAGGLVGVSGDAVSGSYASGAVSGGNGNSMLGGLIGNNNGGAVTNSSATGSVTGNDSNYVGGLIGFNQGASSPISGSYATGNVTNAGGQIGGLAGANESAITNSYATGTVTDTSSNASDAVGGLVGENNSGAITGSYATGTVVSSSSGVDIGGLIGLLSSAGSITNSYATGVVTASNSSDGIGGLVGYGAAAIIGSYATGAVTGGANSYIGGLVGYDDAGGTISHSHATGSVTAGASALAGGLTGENNDAITSSYATGAVTTGDLSYAGGLSGYSSGAITTSYAAGPVAAGGQATAGGLVGYTDSSVSVSYAIGAVSGGAASAIGGLVGETSSGTFTNTYARGSVTGASGTSSSNYTYVGGLIGNFSGGTLAYSYSSGAVSAGSSYTLAGGLVGNNSSGSITQSYWDNQASGFPAIGVGSGSSAGVTGVTTAYLQSGMLPGGFNSTIWTEPAGVYPYFGFQGALVNISGTAYSGSSAIASAGVGVLSGGVLLGSTATNANGLYTFSEPGNMINSAGVLTYLTSGGIANTFSDGANGYLGMDLHTGTLSLISGSITTMSALNAALAVTLGTATGPNFLFTAPVGQLNLTPGASLSLASTASSLTLDQPITGAGNILINSSGNLTIDNGDGLTAGSGDNITLATGGIFTNQAGTSALDVSNGGQWLVYSQNPANDSLDGLTPMFKQYNAVYGVSTPAQSGNGLLYILAPTITVSLTGTVDKVYSGTTSASLSAANLSASGAIQGDTIQLAAPAGAAYANANVNTGIAVTASGFSVASASNGGIPIYGYQVANNSATASIGTITPATLTYTSAAASQAAGIANTSFAGTVTGFVDGQTLDTATTGSAAFSSLTSAASKPGLYAINGSGLTASHGNYVFTQAAGNATALTITVASAPAPTPTPTPTPSPAPAGSPITIDINSLTSLNGQSPTYTATYNGPALSGINITSLLAGLTYQITPALNGPGVYQITATGTAPAGYTFHIVPGTFTVVDTSPALLPTQGRLFAAETPAVLPAVESGSESLLLSPINAIGLFQINTVNTAAANGAFGLSFAGFDGSQTPLAQQSYFSTANDKPVSFVAGAKP